MKGQINRKQILFNQLEINKLFAIGVLFTTIHFRYKKLFDKNGNLINFFFIRKISVSKKFFITKFN